MGFLRYNYPPAKIFMGTVGAQFLGFVLAGISVFGAFKIPTMVAVAIPILILAVPLFDTTFVVLRRALTGKRVSEADTTHLHHRLVNRGLSHRQAVWIIYGLTFLFCAIAYALFYYLQALGARGRFENQEIINRKLRVLAVCGTRPDAVKMAPVVIELKRHPDEVDLVLAVSGQHREMLAQVMEAFDLHPDYDLNIMTARQTLAQITTRALEGLDSVIKETQPDLVLAQGDTTTTFIASLAAFYNKTPFGHVEAGLRTDNKYDPVPGGDEPAADRA